MVEKRKISKGTSLLEVIAIRIILHLLQGNRSLDSLSIRSQNLLQQPHHIYMRYAVTKGPFCFIFLVPLSRPSSRFFSVSNSRVFDHSVLYLLHLSYYIVITFHWLVCYNEAFEIRNQIVFTFFLSA